MFNKPVIVTLLATLTLAGLQGCGGAEDRRARALERGQQYLAEANYDKARIEFSNALQIQPNDADARYYVGLAAEKLNDLRAAAQGYQGVLNVDATHPLALAALGRLYVFSGLATQALEMLEKGLAAHPGHPELLVVRAAAEVALDEEQKAIDDARAVLAAQPNHEYAVALLAGIYRARGEAEQAVEIVASTLERVPDSVDLRTVLAQLHADLGDNAAAEAQLKEIIALRPTDWTQRRRLVAFYASTGRADDAEAMLREVIELDPETIDHKIALVAYLATQRSFDAAEAELKKLIDDNAGDDRLRTAAGQFYEQHNLPRDAEDLYRAVIERDGNGAMGLAARDRLATLMIRESRIDEARPLIAAVLEENPRDNEALVLRAALALAEGHALDAITDLRAVLRDQPDSSSVLRTLARAHVQNKEPDLARENYRRAIEVDPGNSEVRVEYADYLSRSGGMDEARLLLDAVLNAEPQNVTALEIQFRVAGAANDVAAAEKVARTLIEAQPESPLGYYLLGLTREQLRDAQGAVASYETALEKSPRGAEPLGALARVLVLTNRRPEARARIEKVLEQFPDHAVALNLLAELTLADRDLAGALAMTDRAIAADPTWWLPYRTKALVFLAKGAPSDAKAAYRAGLDASGKSMALGMDLASLYERDNEPELAIEVYESLHGVDPNSEPLANNLAMLLSTYREDGGSHEKAHELVRRFRDSSNPAYLNTYGWVRFRQGQVGEAIPYLRRASEAVPQSAQMHYHLGMALLASGQAEQARAELEKALQTEEQYPGKDAALRALESLPRTQG